MQRLFSADGPWPTTWLGSGAAGGNGVSEPASGTDGIYPVYSVRKRATDMPGMWQRYYSRWKDVTRQQLDPALLELPSLAKLCP